MKKGLIALVVVLLTLSLAGCSNPPKPPGSDIPKLVLDYDIDHDTQNKSIIYVHGVDDVRYTNISLKIDNKTVVYKEEAFCIEYDLYKDRFNITLDVWLELEHYNFNVSVEVFPSFPRQKIVYRLTYYDEEVKKIELNDLPYSEALDLMEEEDA